MAKHVLYTTFFAEAVKEWIDGRPLRHVAEDVGISASTLSRIANGHTPDIDTFANLCHQMKVAPELFFGSETYEGEEW